MSKKASPAAIGGFVLGAIALLVAGIVVFSGGKLLRNKVAFVSYFPGTVAGLGVGAPVQFQGVQIGQVTDIKLDYYPGEGRFSVPVSYEIWSDALRISDEEGTYQWSEESGHDRLRRLIEDRGLRAVLSSASLVTGQYMITLELRPGSDYQYVGSDPGVSEIPTVESTRDRLANMLEGLDLGGLVAKASNAMDAISEVVSSQGVREMPEAVDALVKDTRKLVGDLDTRMNDLMTSVDATLADYRTLATTATARIDAMAAALEDVSAKIAALSASVNAQVDPLSREALATLGAVRETAQSYGEMADPQSATRSNLDQVLEEAAGAARSLRILADYLEQNPDALIKGKY